MKKQKGYTLFELLYVILFFAIFGAIGYALVHFIAKFW